MKKIVFLVIGLAGMQLSGALSMMRDYGSVAMRYGANMWKQAVPVVVDIERLQTAIDQLDDEIAKNGRKIVEASVAVDRYATAVSERQASVTRVQSDLKTLRTRFVSMTDEDAKKPLEEAMANRLTRFKAQSQALAASQRTLTDKRQAYETMLAAFEKQKLDRDVLKEKLDAFRADYESMKMRGELSQSALANSASRKASELAIEIADRLEVQRRLSIIEHETLDDISTEQPIKDSNFSLSQVDEAINATAPCATTRVAVSVSTSAD